MRWITITLMLLFPLISKGQFDTEYKNEAGLHLTFAGNDGLGVTLRYKRQIFDLGMAKFEINTNNKNSITGRLGYEFIKLGIGRAELGTGIDVRYKGQDFKDFGQYRYWEVALEIPLEFRFRITPEITAYSGIAFSTFEYNSFLGKTGYNLNRAEIRLGVGYNF